MTLKANKKLPSISYKAGVPNPQGYVRNLKGYSNSLRLLKEMP